MQITNSAQLPDNFGKNLDNNHVITCDIKFGCFSIHKNIRKMKT